MPAEANLFNLKHEPILTNPVHYISKAEHFVFSMLDFFEICKKLKCNET